jgi:hypothetical protein
MLADCDGMLCCSAQINQCKCVLSTSMQLEHMPFHQTVSVFNFVCTAEVIKSISINVSLTRSVAMSVVDACGLHLLQEIGFYLTVLFVVFLPQIVVACLHHCMISCRLV